MRVVGRTDRRAPARAAALGVAALSLAACAHSLPHAPYVAQPTSALLEVTSPPPPGRVEVVPLAPSKTAVWIDGEWSWHHERWAWIAGRWVEPPASAKFSPWVFVRAPDGRLWYAPGTWRDASGRARDAPRILASAHVEPTQVVNASGVVETTGPTLRPPTAVRTPSPGHS